MCRWVCVEFWNDVLLRRMGIGIIWRVGVGCKWRLIRDNVLRIILGE